MREFCFLFIYLFILGEGFSRYPNDGRMRDRREDDAVVLKGQGGHRD